MNSREHVDLKERTLAFGLSAIDVAENLTDTSASRHLTDQFLRSATTVGAHYREASRARSDAEFVSKLDVAIQEADECKYWLELIARSGYGDKQQLADLYREADELIAIQTTIVTNVKQRLD